jgi:hypothetical protein
MDVWDWKNQMANLHYIEKTGTKNVLPVYHIYEWLEWKFKELDEIFEKYDYFAIWGIAVASASGTQKDLFLKYVFSRWNHFRKKQWYPTKIHWFGVTSEILCFKFPFYSVDSTSWLANSRYGGFCYFDKKKRKICGVHGRDIEWLREVWDKIPLEYRDINKISDTKSKIGKPYLARNYLTALAYVEYFEYVTGVWEKRGLKWT